MTDLVERQMPLPKGFCLAPYFEESWKNDNDYQRLIDLIKAIE